MPAIYTHAWYEGLRDLFNNNPEVARSAPRGTFKVLGELHGDGRSPYLGEDERRFFVIHFDDGSCTDYVQVDEPLAAGMVDPVAAGLKGVMKITGDMRVLIRHAGLVNVMRKVYTHGVETIWPKGKPPYAAG
jgi:hypothetical protein